MDTTGRRGARGCRWPRAALAAAVGLTTIGTTAADAQPSHDSRPQTELRTIHIEATYWNSPIDVDGAGCRWQPEAACTVYVSGWTETQGDMEAAGPFSGHVTPRPDGTAAFAGNSYLSGRIKGCGSGTFVYEDVEGTGEMGPFDPVTQSLPAENDWRVDPRSATGEIAARLVSGSGRQVWRAYPLRNLPGQRSGEGRITGTVVCRVPAHEHRSDGRSS